MPVPAGALKRCLVALLLLALTAMGGRAVASGLPLLDPFRDGLAAGDTRYLTTDPASGWPDSLWAPPRWQTGWRRALARLDTLERLRPDTLLAWRVAAALGETLRFRPGPAGIPWPDLPSFRYSANAASVLADTLPPPPAEGEPLPPLDRLVRAWRSAWCDERNGVPLPWPRLWRSLLDLPVADRRAGWQLWSALRRARGLTLVPGDTLDDATARWLASLPPGTLDWRELDRWHLPADAAAGLGAAALRGAPLRRHLAKFPRPPATFTWQRHWLLGRWRAARHDVSLARRLAARDDLHPLARAELLRRLDDLLLSRGDTSGVADDLRRASALVADHEGRTARLVRAMVDRARVLARYRGWEELAAYLATLPHAPADPGSRTRSLVARRVIGGKALSCRDRGRLPPGDLGRRLAAWRRWGLQLSHTGAFPAEAGASYRRLLARRGSGSPTELLTVLTGVCPVSLRRPLREAALLHDLYRVAGPVPRRRGPLHAAVLATQGETATWQRHLLLGLALLLDDPAAQLAAVVRLPAAGVTDRDRLLLSLPVPRDPALRNALASSRADPSLLLAMARHESAFDPAARSGAGALGWLQVMPFHHDGGAWDPLRGPRWRDPVRTVVLADRLLSLACRRRQGDPYQVVAEYNAGPGAVDRWLRQLGGTPGPAVFAAWIGYPETRRYTREVLIDRQLYRWLLEGRPTGSGPATPSPPRS